MIQTQYYSCQSIHLTLSSPLPVLQTSFSLIRMSFCLHPLQFISTISKSSLLEILLPFSNIKGKIFLTVLSINRLESVTSARTETWQKEFGKWQRLAPQCEWRHQKKGTNSLIDDYAKSHLPDIRAPSIRSTGQDLSSTGSWHLHGPSHCLSFLRGICLLPSFVSMGFGIWTYGLFSIITMAAIWAGCSWSRPGLGLWPYIGTKDFPQVKEVNMLFHTSMLFLWK